MVFCSKMRRYVGYCWILPLLLSVYLPFLSYKADAASGKKQKYDTTKFARLCVPDGKAALSSTDRRGHAVLQKILEVTPPRSLEMTDSSPHKAACWMIYDDPKKVSPSSSSFIQRYALTVFWFATAGNKWDEKDDWLSKKDECLWYGVTCTRSMTGTKHVTALDLGFNNLVGLLPRELALLTAMEDIDFHGNEVQGVLPTAIFDSWKQLKILRLHMNGLFGMLPTQIGLLTSLREFLK